MEEKQAEKGFPRWFWIVLLGFAVIVVLNALFMGGPDYYSYERHVTLLREGLNPYEQERGYYYKYPAFYFLFMGAWGYLGVSSYVEIKLIFGLFSLGTCVVLYRFCTQIFEVDSDARILFILFIYWFNPLHLQTLLAGENDVVAMFFLLLAVYTFLQDRYVLSTFWLGLGVNFKVFPLLFLIPVTLAFLKRKEWKNLIFYWGGQAVVFLGCSAYFLWQDSSLFLEGLLSHTSRIHDGFSWGAMFPCLYTPLFHLPWEDTSISLWFIVQILVLGGFFLVGYVSEEDFGSKQVLMYTVLIYALFPLLGHQDHPMNWVRYLPIFVLVFGLHHPIGIDHVNRAMKISFILVCTMFVGMVIAFFVQLAGENGELTNYNNPLYFLAIFLFHTIYLVFLARFHKQYIHRPLLLFVLLSSFIFFISMTYASFPPTEIYVVPFLLRTLAHLGILFLLWSYSRTTFRNPIPPTEKFERFRDKDQSEVFQKFANPKYVRARFLSTSDSSIRLSLLERASESMDASEFTKLCLELSKQPSLHPTVEEFFHDILLRKDNKELNHN